MKEDALKKAVEIKKTKDDATTIAEHTAILLRYQQTGYLDKDDAIEKYEEFNENHKEYYCAMSIQAAYRGTVMQIRDPRIPCEVIVGNLNQQLFYLTGKNLLEDSQKQI